ncbi:MAG: NAD(P)-binding protein, partial [Nonomuraea sp.]|nr:NAD(P)-binding protein [Nonomuraea sp.]
MTLHVAIIGGGLAGPCLAHGLRRAGFGVSLYERDADRGQGYRIHLAPEGDQALRDCLPDHLYRLVHDTAGIPGSGVTVFDGELNVLNRIAGGGGLSVDRQTFRAILTTDLDDVLHQGAEFTRYEELPDGRVRAHFADGSAADADLLVGADGATSRVRRQLLPHARVDDLGIALVVGKARLTPEVRAVVPPQSLDGFSTVVGSGGRFMPLAGHQFRNRPAEYGLPDVPDYVMWALGLPGDVSGLDGAGLLDLALDRTSNWHPGLH